MSERNIYPKDTRIHASYCLHSYTSWWEAHNEAEHGGQSRGRMERCERAWWDNCQPEVGDVWLCEHGKVMLADGKLSDPYEWSIRELDPTHDRREYRLALAALATDADGACPDCGRTDCAADVPGYDDHA